MDLGDSEPTRADDLALSPAPRPAGHHRPLRLAEGHTEPVLNFVFTTSPLTGPFYQIFLNEFFSQDTIALCDSLGPAERGCISAAELDRLVQDSSA